MYFLLTSTLSFDEVIEHEPPYNYFDELFSLPFGLHFTVILFVLISVLLIIATVKGSGKGEGITTLVSIVATLLLVLLFTLPLPGGVRFSEEWNDWKVTYVETYMEDLPTETTTMINKREIEKVFLGDSYKADIAFSVGNELITKSNVEIIPKGDEYLVSYKYLAEELPEYNSGYYDVKLIVPEDFAIN